jgi:hypothetical protein
MGQKKNQTGNLNGRPKGVQNKVTREVKEHIAKFVEGKLEEFIESFEAIKKPEIKARVYLEAAKLILPRPKDEEEENEADRRAKELLDRLWPINRD